MKIRQLPWHSMTKAQLIRLRILIGLAYVAVILSLVGVLLSGDVAGLIINLGTEIAGAIVIFILINGIIESNIHAEEAARKTEEDRLRLITELKSKVNANVIEVADQLRYKGWLKLPNVDLIEAELRHVNLSTAEMDGADFRDARASHIVLVQARVTNGRFDGADLTSANLRGATLDKSTFVSTNMAKANLVEASLERAQLIMCDLQSASLVNANLRNSIISACDLRGTNLTGAVLHGASVRDSKFDDTTIMPDGIAWKSESAIDQFTNISAN